MVIFDCNGVLVDSEPVASTVLAQAFTRAGFPLTAEIVARRFHGRRPADIFAVIEAGMGRKLPPNFATTVTLETLRRFRGELRAIPHVAHALTWLRGPKAVASSSPLDRIRWSLEATGLLRFFERRVFSASEVPNGKPAPDLFQFAAERMKVDPANCIVVGFGGGHFGGWRGRHDADRFRRRQPVAGSTCQGTRRRRRHHRHRRHADPKEHHHRPARLVDLCPPAAGQPVVAGGLGFGLALAFGFGLGVS